MLSKLSLFRGSLSSKSASLVLRKSLFRLLSSSSSSSETPKTPETPPTGAEEKKEEAEKIDYTKFSTADEFEMLIQKLEGGDKSVLAESLTQYSLFNVRRRNLDEAMKLIERAAETWLLEKGEKSSQYATSLFNMSHVHLARGEANLARPLMEKALSIQEERLGKNHLLVGYTLKNLGDMNLQNSLFKDAAEHYERAHSIFAENFGEKSPDALTTKRTWGFAAAMTGDHKKGREILQSALSIVREQCESPEPSETDPKGMGGADDVANMLNEIAVLELSCGDADASMKYLDESLRIYKGNHGIGSLECASVMRNIANAHLMKNEYDKALELLDRAHVAVLETFGEDHDLAKASARHIEMANKMKEQKK